MDDAIRLVAFTLLPGGSLLGAIGYAGVYLYRRGDRSLAIVPIVVGFGLVLGFMSIHQIGELLAYVETGGFRDPTAGEVPETSANVVAAATTVYALRYIDRETELRRREQEASERLETIFQNVNDGVLLVDIDDDRIVEANRRAAEMLRYPGSELVGLSPYEIHPHERSQLEAVMGTVRTDGGIITEELSCRRSDGTRMPAAISASPLSVDGNDAMLVTIRDNTRRERLDSHIDLLGRVLRHNFRNDLNVVVGYLEILEARVDNGELESRATACLDRCAEMMELTEKTRRLNEILQDERKGRPTSTDIVPLAAGTVREFREEHPEANVETEFPESAPVRADSRFGWAIEELLENAVEHADAGAPTVRVAIDQRTITDEGVDSEWVRLTVADDGPGIPEMETEVVLDDSLRLPTKHGSGLGLWVVSQLVGIFEGELDIETPGEEFSTVVSIRLPCERV